MKCFLTIIQAIGATVMVFALVSVALAVLVAATLATAWLLGATGSWVMAILFCYFFIGVGTAVGLEECWGE